MIDVWMICTMLYPFCVVTLYSAIEVFKNKKTCKKICSMNPIETKDLINTKTIKTLTFVLNWGLPVVVTIFILIFWILGLTNSDEQETLC